MGTDDFFKEKDLEFKKYRRSIYVVKDIKKNQLLTKFNIKKLDPQRNSSKILLSNSWKKGKKNIHAGTPLKFNLIK